jgi:predicted nucleic acid-binding protein
MTGKYEYILDTNVIISIIAGRITIPEHFKFDPYIAISVITEIELLSFKHLSEHEETVIRNLLKDIDIINLNDAVKETTIQLRKKHSIKTPDAIISATALVTNSTLVTDDAVLLNLRQLGAISIKNFISNVS